MKFLKIVFLFVFLSCAHGNPVKRDGVVYEILRALPQSEVPMMIVNLDQSDESMSDEEEVPAEFPFEKAISVDQMVFKDGEWHKVEKPDTQVIIKRSDGSTWINKEISNKKLKFGSGRERKDNFDSKPMDKNRSAASMSASAEALPMKKIEKIAKANSEPSMSASEEDRKVDLLNSESSMSSSVDRYFKELEERRMQRKIAKRKLSKKPVANSEPSMSASAEAMPMKKIEKYAKADSEPSMSASEEKIIKIAAASSSSEEDDKHKQIAELILIPMTDINEEKEIDLIISPDGEKIIKIEKNQDSKEISYNFIDSDLAREEETKETAEVEQKKQLGQVEAFYRRILDSIMTAMTLGHQQAYGSVMQ